MLHLAHLSLCRVPHIHLEKLNCKFCHNKLERGISYSQKLTWLQTELKEISVLKDSHANAEGVGHWRTRGKEGRCKRQDRWRITNHRISLLFTVFLRVESASIPHYFYLKTQYYTYERSDWESFLPWRWSKNGYQALTIKAFKGS